MWFIIYNDKALWAVLIGVLAGAGMASYSRMAAPTFVTAGAVMMAIDLIGRIKDGESSPALLHPDSGGHMWFITVWIVGLLTSAGAGAAWLGWL